MHNMSLGHCQQVAEHELDSICLPPNATERKVQVLLEWVKQKVKQAILACLCNALGGKATNEKDVPYKIKTDPVVTSPSNR